MPKGVYDHAVIKKQFCPKGHDKDVVGRTSSRNCEQCRQDISKKYYQDHKDELKQYFQKLILEHPESIRISKLKCKTNRGLRVVSWGQDGIKEFYINMPKGMTEEHYIPLQGEKVSGLHVIWNLQYLPKYLNSKKNNRINLLEASEWYGKILEKEGLK